MTDFMARASEKAYISVWPWCVKLYALQLERDPKRREEIMSKTSLSIDEMMRKEQRYRIITMIRTLTPEQIEDRKENMLALISFQRAGNIKRTKFDALGGLLYEIR